MVNQIAESKSGTGLYIECVRFNAVNNVVICFSVFGTTFVLRRLPPEKVMKSLIAEYGRGHKPVITFKYYGFSSDEKPLYATCLQVVSFPLFSYKFLAPHWGELG
jgi:hypothetical protein